MGVLRSVANVEAYSTSGGTVGKNPVYKVIEEARKLEARRQEQIRNQIAAINRLVHAMNVEEPWSYDDEMQKLHELLAASNVALRELVLAVESGDQGDIEDAMETARKLLP